MNGVFSKVLLVLPVLAADPLSATARDRMDAPAVAQEIDRAIQERLDKAKVMPSGLADDAEFLRRVYLDLHGVVPTAEQAARFLTDSRTDRRTRLIDALLDDPRYGEYLADVWQGYLVSPLADDRRVRGDQLRKWLAE